MHEISSSAKNTELLILLNVPSDFYQTEEKKKKHCFSTHDFLWKANFSVSTKEKKQQQ